MLGEYVIELAKVIRSNLAALAPATYAAFVASNPSLMALTRCRAISYWDCYYRREFPDRNSCPSLQVLE